MKRFGIAIVLDGFPSLDNSNVFEMHNGTSESQAWQYFGYCQPPRTGSIALVELDGSGAVARTIARLFGEDSKDAGRRVFGPSEKRGNGVRQGSPRIASA